ncbi:hypothetical protein [Halobacterium zhouii]|uniref:hypothetical protein n=1 Tax=Halobacterium zhouii TaxID=2902624 RepID=UPI001E477D0B|nr:hypothetical protein [Halobacterium zhouii]
MNVRRLLVGPRRSALRVGIPVVATVFVVGAVSTVVYLDANEPGVYFPVDAAFAAVVASTLYAIRYHAFAVCVAIGVAAFAGSAVGFHVLGSDGALLTTLARFATDLEAATIGGIFGVLGAAAGGAVGRVLRFRRRTTA